MTHRLQDRRPSGLSVVGRLCLGVWGALAAAALAASPAQAAVTFRTVEQAFSFSDQILINEQTIFAPGNLTDRGSGVFGVSGRAVVSGSRLFSLPEADPTLGVLESVAVEIVSQGVWRAGMSAASLPYKPSRTVLF